MSVRVRWHREAWWVFAQSPKIPNRSGKKARRIGPTDADREKAEAIARRLRERLGEAPPGEPVRVDDACREWLDTYGTTLKPTTREGYRSLVEGWLAPHFGATPLDALRDADLLAFVQHVLETPSRATDKAGEPRRSGHALGTARNALAILRRVGNVAVREGRVGRNPVSDVGRLLGRLETAQAEESTDPDAWSPKEVRTILELAREREPRLYPFLAVLFGTGARRGEVLALRWSDVDLVAGTVRIRRRVSQGKLATPKSKRGIRDVEIDAELVAILREHRAASRREWPFRDPQAWVFPTLDGRRRMTEKTLSEAWNRLRRRFPPEVRPLRLHDARHTYATLAGEAGRPVGWVAKQLGQDPETTLRTYTHAFERQGAERGFSPWRLVSTDGIQGKPDQAHGGGKDP